MLEAARQDGYPIKVGIVGSPDDLTDDPSMFGRPQAYAEYVASKLGSRRLQAPVVIVSPKGVGVAGMQPKGTQTLPIAHVGRCAARRAVHLLLAAERRRAGERGHACRPPARGSRRPRAPGRRPAGQGAEPDPRERLVRRHRRSAAVLAVRRDLPRGLALLRGPDAAGAPAPAARRPASRPSRPPEVHMPNIGPTGADHRPRASRCFILGPKRLPVGGPVARPGGCASSRTRSPARRARRATPPPRSSSRRCAPRRDQGPDGREPGPDEG